MINLTVKKKSISEIFAFIGALLVIGLMSVYLNNTYKLNLYSTQWMQIGILLIGMCLLVFYHKFNKLMLSAFLLGLSILLPAIFNSIENYGIMGLISKSFLWFFVIIIGYGYGKSKKTDDNKYIILGMLLTLVYIYCSNTFLDFSIANKNYVQTSIYYLICMIPFVFVVLQKKIRLIVLVLICLLTFISFKRSAILVLIITLLVNFCVNIKKNNIKQLFKYIVLIVVIFSIVFGVYAKIQNWDTNDLLNIFNIWNNRFEESNSRESIYSYVLRKQYDSSFLEWMFGHGHNAVMDNVLFGLSSHCDYLEILYDYGIIAESLFVYFIVVLMKKAIKFIRKNSTYGSGYISSIVIFIVASVPSHMLTYSTYFLILCFFWGYMEAVDESYEERKKKCYENRNINVS